MACSVFLSTTQARRLYEADLRAVLGTERSTLILGIDDGRSDGSAMCPVKYGPSPLVTLQRLASLSSHLDYLSW